MNTEGSNVANRGRLTHGVLDCGGKRRATPLCPETTANEKRHRRFVLPAPSKTWQTLLVFCFLTSPLCLPASAQYAIDWFTIDGGGGTSTGSVYSVSGTIGQPDAGGPMTNGQYSVTGGFWALPTVVQTTNAPTLTIAPATPGNATISWTPNTPGFVLQETANLSLPWTNSLSGATNPIVVPAALPTKFYRLFKP